MSADGAVHITIDDEVRTGYPAPRKPLTESTPVETVEPEVDDDTLPSARMREVARTAHRRRRRKRILTSSVVVGIVGVGALVAALVVPGVLAESEAELAAATFQSERDEWQTAFSADRLAPFAEYSAGPVVDEIAAADAALSVAPGSVAAVDDAALTGACAEATDLQGEAAALSTVAAPSEPFVAGTADDGAYLLAHSLWQEEQPMYQASETLGSDLDAAFVAVDAACTMAIERLVIAQDVQSAAAALGDLAIVADGETQSVAIESVGWVSITCAVPTGCPDLADPAARAAAGDAWDATFTAMHSSLADLYADACPTLALAEACDALAEAQLEQATLAAAVGDAFDADDPAAAVLAGSSATPSLDAAIAEYVDGVAQHDAAAQLIVAETTGADSFLAALATEVETASTTISESASAIDVA